MFIDIINKNQDERLKELNQKIKAIFGFVPSNLALLGSIDTDKLQNFLSYILTLSNHKSIHKDYFAFLRLFIAYQEDFSFCIKFNTALLQSKKYSLEVINNTKNNFEHIPFDNKHKVLAIKSIKSIFHSKNFLQSDFEELYKLGWDDKDIFTSIEHVGFMLQNGRILGAYMKKDK